MTDAVAIALVATIVPTLTVVLTWTQQRRKINDVVTAVNGRLSAALAANEYLSKEVLRLAGGGTPTPAVNTDPDGHAPVQVIDGVVTVVRKASDPAK